MALRAHVKDGKVVCSSCATPLSAESASCTQCGESLEGDLDAMVCPYCAAVLKRYSNECSQCGLRFRAVKKPVVEKGTEDEEFLKRLLEWGKKMKATDEETDEDVAEKEQAHTVLKTIIGTREPTPLQKETLQEIEKTAEEKKAFEVREESILSISEPLEAALRARHASIHEAENELVEISKELDELNSRQDPKAMAKRERLEHKRELLETEKKEIQRLEDRLNEIDETYKKLLADHKRELDEKEANLKGRLDAFKQEMERRDDEKRRMEKKEAMLQIKEREASATLERLRERERALEAREAELTRKLDALRAERDALASGSSGAPTVGLAGKWIIDPGEVEDVFKKSKKAREDWFAEQKAAQAEIMARHAAQEPQGVHPAKAGPAYAQEKPADNIVRDDPRVAQLDARIKELVSKIDHLEAEKASVNKAEAEAKEFDDDLKKVLRLVDDLLGKLPDDAVDAFAKSDEFKLYQKVLDKYLGGT
jgi:DNA repair exonuclease SbcCD ATPase subunit